MPNSIVIESGVDDIEVAVKQGGKTIELLDGSTGSTLRLRSGTYELNLNGEHNTVRVSPTEFRLLRGKTQVVRITHDTPRKESLQVPKERIDQNEELEKHIVGWYCSIDWGNNAPLTNGFIRAAPDGNTLLQGFKWQEDLSLDVVDGSLRAIVLTSDRIAPIAGQTAPQDSIQSDELERR